MLGATVAVQEGLAAGESAPLASLAAAGVVIMFSMWWLYFAWPTHHPLTSRKRAFIWGYGHFVDFAAIAAVGGGLELAVDYDLDRTELAALPAGMALTVPVAVFLLAIRLLRIRPAAEHRPRSKLFPRLSC